ncbi:MAG: CBS domain-containing protein [Actinomycetes bacterium]
MLTGVWGASLRADPDRPATGDGLRVADVMVTIPKEHSTALDVAGARRAFDDDHVHMLLLVDGTTLRGTLTRADVDRPLLDSSAALEVSTLAGRIIEPSRSTSSALRLMRRQGLRRLAVVDRDGSLLGLLCLKRALAGWCSDDGVRSRAAEAGCGPDCRSG